MHEVNGPLEAAGNLLFLCRLESSSPEKVLDYVRQAEEQVIRAQQVAQRALSFFREHAQPRPVHLPDMLQAALFLYDDLIRAKELRVKRDWPEAVTVPAHRGELLQVISNLIINAIEALHHGGTMHIRLRPRSDGVRLTIADNGPGIPEGFRKKLFQPFQTANKPAGTGLGLWVAKSIIQKHGGRISCRSSVRQGRSGTAFSIMLTP
jgi:signal transduction histidine kinase